MNLQKSNKLTFTIILVALLSSCEKFEHQNTTDVQECVLCEFADSLNGVYKGFSAGAINPIGNSYYGSPVPLDTFEFHVEHIFLNKGSIIDSSIMFFHIYGNYQSNPMYVIHDTIMIDNFEGNVVAPFPKSGSDCYWFTPDSMRIYDYAPVKMPYVARNYKGYRL